MYAARISLLCGLAVIVMGAISVTSYLDFAEPDASLIEQGKHYKTECKLLETNIKNGVLSADTNRIDCSGVINNLATSDYDSAIDAYENSNKISK